MSGTVFEFSEGEVQPTDILDVDLTTVGVVPEGQYQGQIVKGEKKLSKPKPGKPQYKFVNWTIFLPDVGSNVYLMTSIGDDAWDQLRGFKKLCKAAGMPMVNPSLGALIGAMIKVNVTIKTDDMGEPQNEVQVVVG